MCDSSGTLKFISNNFVINLASEVGIKLSTDNHHAPTYHASYIYTLILCSE